MNIKYKRLVLAQINLLVLLILINFSCSRENNDDKNIYNSNDDYDDLDSIMYTRNPEFDDSLLMVIKTFDITPETINARLELLSQLNKFEEALVFLSKLSSNDFERPYDSVRFKNYFKSKLLKDQKKRDELSKQTVDYIKMYLVKHPLDTLTLASYCEYKLKYMSRDKVYNSIDSMSSSNNFHPVYDFIISIYFPEVLDKNQGYKSNGL